MPGIWRPWRTRLSWIDLYGLIRKVRSLCFRNVTARSLTLFALIQRKRKVFNIDVVHKSKFNPVANVRSQSGSRQDVACVWPGRRLPGSIAPEQPEMLRCTGCAACRSRQGAVLIAEDNGSLESVMLLVAFDFGNSEQRPPRRAVGILSKGRANGHHCREQNRNRNPLESHNISLRHTCAVTRIMFRWPNPLITSP